jgi:hypothetical protein
VDSNLPDYHVLGDQIQEETTLAPGGAGIQQVYNVPYRVDSGPAMGSQHTVRVAPSEFTPARVQDLIEQHLNSVHGVAQIGKASA